MLADKALALQHNKIWQQLDRLFKLTNCKLTQDLIKLYITESIVTMI